MTVSDAASGFSPADTWAAFPPEELLAGVFDVSLTGLLLLRPLPEAAPPEAVADFAYAYVNPAAQRILALPAQPARTLLEVFPDAVASGVLGFYREALASPTPLHLDVRYQRHGLDSYYRLAARRVGPGLLVSLTDTDAQPRTATEQVLRDSRAREQHARAEAEIQRNRLHQLLLEAPALIATYHGPEHVFGFVNAQHQALLAGRVLLGRPLREALPELAQQPIYALLEAAYHSGELQSASEMPVKVGHDNAQVLSQNYYNVFFQPTRDAAGQVDGVLGFAYEVTAQVQARRQIEEKEQELRALNMLLGAANEELATVNEGLRHNNAALQHAQQALRQLNQELEARVQQRTYEADAARAEAERQRARLERFFMQAPAAICVLDGPELVYELVNPGYQRLFPDRALLGRPLAEAMPEFARQPIWLILQRVYQSGEPYEGRETLVQAARQAGGPVEDRYFTFIYQPRHDAAGLIDGVLVFAYEVTALVQARRRVEQSELEFRLLSDAIPHLVWTATPAGAVDYCNEQWCAYTGGAVAEALYDGWSRYFHPQDLPRMQQHWASSLHSGQPYQVEARLRRHDGQYRWFLARALALRDEHGQITRWFGTATDMHQQKGLAEALQLASRKLATTNRELRAANDETQTINQELAQANRQLTRINQDLDNFVYTASHDLRQPVYNLAGVFQELKRTATFHDPEAPQLMQMFEGALGQIHNTIQGLSEVVQVERRNAQDATEPVALLPLAQEVIQSMHEQATATGAAFRLDFAAVPALRFARLNLQSIFYNLLSNALKYRHPDRAPVVRVRTTRTDEGAPVLLVQDNGLGLDVARYGPDLFQLFRRFHDHVGGSGLGLYLVNRIVQQAGGRIEVDSVVGEGTTFRILLPAAA
ncbi:PAS domain-containing protein [Hymenobacter jeollabukensis]|uniref:PAS domain-containing protein n=1 Tax=Hymenobacter jeollabukensis TaxID=2025313 RepID=UPI0014851E62|nr:PAS domain-containing protein [Hymenobacter jeollabukensis]